ncbi:hypothetical protein ACFSR7_36480, partial [Cohnella sp. GCM10020058]
KIVVVGTTGQYGYVDGVRVYEISSADYSAIDSMTAAQVAAKWPYVDDAKHVNAVYVHNAGKNLLPGSPDSLHANAVVTSQYSLMLNATATFQDSAMVIPVLPSQSYKFLGNTSSSNCGFVGAFLDDKQASISGIAGGGWLQGLTFTTPSNCSYVRIVFTNNAVGSFVLSNWQLELGSVATTFETKRGSHLYLPDAQLRSNVDGSVADSLYTDGEGKPRVTRRLREQIEDGTQAWIFVEGLTGYKRVKTVFSGLPTGSTNMYAIKYDGKLIKAVSIYSVILADTCYVENGSIFIGVSSTDSGWADAYTPSAAEIAAYFYGWKMYPSDTDSTGTAAYTGTGTKRWMARKADGSLDLGNLSTANTVPTSQAPLFTPYRLIYQLAASVDEALNYEGDLVLHEGGNQIEVGTGIVVREAAKPALASQWYVFNDTTTSVSTSLKYRTDRIRAIYRNQLQDNQWMIDGTNA